MSDIGYILSSHPQDIGLEQVGLLEWNGGGYEWDELRVWRQKETGKIYWLRDSGCSCNGFGDNVSSIDDLYVLTKGTWKEFENDAGKVCEVNEVDRVIFLSDMRKLVKR